MGRTLMRTLRANRFAVQLAIDETAWFLGILFGTAVRFDFVLSETRWRGVVIAALVALVAQLVSGLAFGLYIGRWRFGSFEEVAALVRAAFVTTFVVFAVAYPTTPRIVPLSAIIAGGVAALVLMSGARYLWRAVLERRRRPSSEGRTRVLVFGAGEGAAQVITSMLRDPRSPYVPMALLDDDRTKRNLRIMGVPVSGTRASMAEVARKHACTTLLIAIPSAGAKLVGELTDLAVGSDLRVMVLPPVGELLGSSVQVADIRPLTEADLLGRHEVETDLDSIAGYLTGKRVLVTGAGGSIGSELCRQISRFSPKELLMLDRDESALLAVQLSLDGRANLDSPDLLLCDIRDGSRLERLFTERRPQVVFHAAALKHVPLLEAHPCEAVRTNVFGTLTLLELASACGVERFVNISTDKAADPANALGFSKRISERLTAAFAGRSPGTFLSVRFGNVLGSRGSMLETFRSQIDAGGPVTVTHPEVTRYFMTIEESVQLVIQAGAIGEDGAVLVLDMGEPVSIAEVAERMVARSERDIRIQFTGLRAGEKLHEVLLGEGENGQRRVHPLITHVAVPPLDPIECATLDPAGPRAVLLQELRSLCSASPIRQASPEPEEA